jgi:hypothetical protein
VRRAALQTAVRISYCRLRTDFGKQVPGLPCEIAVLKGVVEGRKLQMSTSALLRVEATALF